MLDAQAGDEKTTPIKQETSINKEVTTFIYKKRHIMLK